MSVAIKLSLAQMEKIYACTEKNNDKENIKKQKHN